MTIKKKRTSDFYSIQLDEDLKNYAIILKNKGINFSALIRLLLREHQSKNKDGVS